MIIELPNYVDEGTINNIRSSIIPFLSAHQNPIYNRDGKTILISKIPELKYVDDLLANIFTQVQKDIVSFRYKPMHPSADSGYEYHLYRSGEVCHYHADGELSPQMDRTLLRYASVILHLNTLEEGGELVFPSQNKTIKTEKGKVVIFPPYGMFGHYTTPSAQEREIIVTWFVYNGLYVGRD